MVAPDRFKNIPWIVLAVLVLSPAAFLAQQETAKPETAPVKTGDAQEKTEAAPVKTEAEKDDKVISGMSILGNQDAPKSLVIVPWKSSELGDSVGISTMLDDSRVPIDKEVFMRMLSYYEIRSETAHPSAAPATENAAQPAAAQRRKR
jgi:cytoskeletal protein RodZ